MNLVSAAAVISALLLLPAGAQSPEHPPSVTPEGGAPVRKATEAARVDLLGAREFYTLAVYVNGSPADSASLRSPDVPKALRIAVTFKEDLSRRVPLDWRRELVPALDAQGSAHLRGTFAPLRYGDVVLIEYVPKKGTAVSVNTSTTVGEASHDLMLAFLDHWMGQRPVSEAIKKALLGSP
jgi:hypothetical protein